MNGGYILVDCTGLEINETEKQTISGIFAKIKKAYETNKPVYAYNCTFNGARMTPIAVMVNPIGADYVGTASTLQLWVDKDDGVTIVNFITD